MPASSIPLGWSERWLSLSLQPRHHGSIEWPPLLLLTPPCPLTAAPLLGLKATVLLLITLLIKARIQIKVASALGLFLLALQTLLFLAAAGALGVAVLGALFIKPYAVAAPTAP